MTRTVAKANRPAAGATPAWREAAFRLQALLRDELGHRGDVPLHSPTFGREDREMVLDCLESGWVSSVGRHVDGFEAELARATGAGHAIAVVNGTAALHVALVAAGVGAGDAVLCPALTFVATANAIRYCGALPIFADSDLPSLGLDAARLERFLEHACRRDDGATVHRDSGRRIVAVVPVHIFGHPVDMDRIGALAEAHGIAVVEDAAEAIGSTYHGRGCGTLARMGTLSFNGNKPVTTGGGGAVLTDDAALAGRLRHLTTTARIAGQAWAYDHDEVGFNYRMPNINAAIGRAQLGRLSQTLADKRALAARYQALFADLDGIDVVIEPPGCRGNYWLNAILLEDRSARDAFLEETNRAGLMTRPCWRLMPDTPAHRDAPVADDLAGARAIEARLATLQSSPWLVADAGARDDG